MGQVTNLSKDEWIKMYHALPDEGKSGLVADYLITEMGDEYPNLRQARILDTYKGEDWDVGTVITTERNRFMNGFAIVGGGEGHIYVDQTRSKLGDKEFLDGTVLDGPSRNPFVSFFGGIIMGVVNRVKKSDPIYSGKLLVECRPTGLVVRENNETLIDICEETGRSIDVPVKLIF